MITVMNIMEAAQKMVEGYKVRRPRWAEGMSLHLNDGSKHSNFPCILSDCDDLPVLDCDDLLASDWVVAK